MRVTEDRRPTARQAQAGGSPRKTRTGRSRRAAGPISTLQLAAMRLRRGGPLLTLLALGMLVASVVACTIPLYNALVSNVQLQRTLTSSVAASHNIDAFATYNHQFTGQANLASEVQRLATENVGSITDPAPWHYAVADPVLVDQIGERTFNLAQGVVQTQLGAMDYNFTSSHMHFIAGHAPQPVAAGSEPEAIIQQEMVDCYGTKVGDTIKMVAFGNHDNALTVKVVGVWDESDINDPFWNGVLFKTNTQCPQSYSVLTTFNDLYSSLSAGLATNAVEHWVYYTQLPKITLANIDAVQTGVGEFRTHIGQDLPLDIPDVSQSSISTQLDTLLQSVQKQTSLYELPLYFIAAPVIGLALLFIAAIAAMLIEAQAQELATLKSRGLSGTQLVGSFALQGALPTVIAFLVGPPLAALTALALVRSVLPAEVLAQSGVSPAYLTSIVKPSDVLIAALAASLLGFLALTFSALQAARLDVLAFRREAGRSTHPPLWRRLYLDVALAVICVLGYLELSQFGATSTRLQLGDLANSPMLLAAPTLLLLAGALLLLRILPPAARLGAQLATRSRGLTGQLAFTSIARAPARPARVVLLLALAVGLGLFAVTFNAALAQNAQDRASYQAGADVRLQLVYGLGKNAQKPYEATVAKLPGVTTESAVYHGAAVTATGTSTGNQTLDLLGVDPASFERVVDASWRDDYADVSLSVLMSRLAAPSGTEKPVIISDTLASALHIHTDDRVALQLGGNTFTQSPFRVVAIAHEFPTLYPNQYPLGFAVANLADVTAGIEQGESSPLGGPNEIWLKTSQDPKAQSDLLSTINSQRGSLNVSRVYSRASELQDIEFNPLNAGMRGLLLVGAAIAALLAIVGILVQSILAARQRTSQFAVLRTLGMARAQLTRLLLSEQLIVYFMGVVGGTVIGVVLAAATLPFLQFGDTTLDPSTIGVPPYRLALDPRPALIFYAALLVAFAVSLLLAARYANRLGLGRALRVGED